MSIVKHRLYQKYGEGDRDYKIVHLETSSDVVLRPGTTKTIEDAVDTLERKVAVIIDRFDKEGVLKPEHGGTNPMTSMYAIKDGLPEG